MPQDEELKVTPVEEWVANPEGFIVTLPQSKKNVRIKRTLDMMTQLKAGMIPNPLARIIREMMLKGVSAEGEGMDTDQFDEESLQQMLELQDRMVISAVTEPKVSAPPPRGKAESDEAYVKRVEEWKPPKGTLPLSLIPLADRQYITAIAQGAAVDVIPFRSEPAADVANVSAVQALPSTPQQPPRAARRAAAKKSAPKQRAAQ